MCWLKWVSPIVSSYPQSNSKRAMFPIPRLIWRAWYSCNAFRKRLGIYCSQCQPQRNGSGPSKHDVIVDTNIPSNLWYLKDFRLQRRKFHEIKTRKDYKLRFLVLLHCESKFVLASFCSKGPIFIDDVREPIKLRGFLRLQWLLATHSTEMCAPHLRPKRSKPIHAHIRLKSTVGNGLGAAPRLAIYLCGPKRN